MSSHLQQIGEQGREKECTYGSHWVVHERTCGIPRLSSMSKSAAAAAGGAGAAAAAPVTEAKRVSAVRAEKPGLCQIDGCERAVHSVAKKTLNWVAAVCLVPFTEDFDAGRKHHCRACSRRVCTAHFVTSKTKGERRCTECAEAGGDAASGGAGGSHEHAAGRGHAADADSAPGGAGGHRDGT